jgi:RNA polymerase sigma-70 factor (ECF subfamily)
VSDDSPAAPDRARLLAIAYRMVGSRSEAEDLVQEALLRVHLAGERQRIDTPDAYATTVLTRLAIDHLRSARVRRDAYVGPWLPEPIATDPSTDAEAMAEMGDSLSLAFLVVLESLAPAERAALLLHDVFGYGYPDIARMLDRTEPACRQLVSRARARVLQRRPRFDVDPAHHAELVDRFLHAVRGEDLDALVAMLSDDASLVSDGGGTVKAARHPVLGRDRVARFVAHIMRRQLVDDDLVATTVNGLPAFAVVGPNGELRNVGTFEVVDGRIARIHIVVNPDKLRWVTGA